MNKRINNKTIEGTIINECPLCKKKDSFEQYDRSQLYMRCKECNLVYIARPAAYNYEEDYYFFDPRHEKQQMRRAEFLFKIVKNELLLSNACVLDVGCGTGHFVSLCHRNGYKATGADISNKAVQISRDRAKDCEFVHFSEVEELLRHFGSNSFDAVTLWEVVEHVLDPLYYLKILEQLLKKGGKLFISTPNVDSIYSRIMGEKWHGFQGTMPQYHIRYFNQKSLLFLLDNTEEKIITISPPAETILIPRNLSQKFIPNIKFVPLRRILRGAMTFGLIPLVLAADCFANPRGYGDTLIAISKGLRGEKVEI